MAVLCTRRCHTPCLIACCCWCACLMVLPPPPCLHMLVCHLVSLTAFLLQLSFLPTLIPCLLAVLPGSSHLQLGMSDEPLHGQGFFGTYPGKYLWAAKCPACTQLCTSACSTVCCICTGVHQTTVNALCEPAFASTSPHTPWHAAATSVVAW